MAKLTKAQKKKRNKILVIIIGIFVMLPIMIILQPWKNNLNWAYSTFARLTNNPVSKAMTWNDPKRYALMLDNPNMSRFKVYGLIKKDLKARNILKFPI